MVLQNQQRLARPEAVHKRRRSSSVTRKSTVRYKQGQQRHRREKNLWRRDVEQVVKRPSNVVSAVDTTPASKYSANLLWGE